MTAKSYMTLGGISLFLIALAASRSFGWVLVNAKISRDFPEVNRITTAELAAWTADDKRLPPLLLDVRARAEYELSHLNNAEHAEPDAPASDIARPKDQPIVTYCSVGYRSGAFAEKLRAAGYTSVVNLEGSIFRWANEGRPVYHGDARVSQVHPYNRIWGLLLEKKYRAQISEGAGLDH